MFMVMVSVRCFCPKQLAKHLKKKKDINHSNLFQTGVDLLKNIHFMSKVPPSLLNRHVRVKEGKQLCLHLICKFRH